MISLEKELKVLQYERNSSCLAPIVHELCPFQGDLQILSIIQKGPVGVHLGPVRIEIDEDKSWLGKD